MLRTYLRKVIFPAFITLSSLAFFLIVIFLFPVLPLPVLPLPALILSLVLIAIVTILAIAEYLFFGTTQFSFLFKKVSSYVHKDGRKFVALAIAVPFFILILPWLIVMAIDILLMVVVVVVLFFFSAVSLYGYYRPLKKFNLERVASWFFFVTLGVIFAVMAWVLGWAGILLSSIGMILFFRNPDRVVPMEEGLIVSPADGTVSSIREMIPSDDLGLGSGKRIRISIFLSIFDVHVNRIPIAGTIVDLIDHTPGVFKNALFNESSEANNRRTAVIETSQGDKVAVSQIVGLIARRIVTYTAIGDSVETGQCYGLIRFGSRVDIYLPLQTSPMVLVGQKMVGGETILANCGAQRKESETKERG